MFGHHFINDDLALIEFLVIRIKWDTAMTKAFYDVVKTSKKPKILLKKHEIQASSNAMTLLVAARFKFHGLDLSNISVPKAILRNGRFWKVNFSHADLTGENLTNAKIWKANFFKTVNSQVELGLYPEIPFLDLPQIYSPLLYRKKNLIISEIIKGGSCFGIERA